MELNGNEMASVKKSYTLSSYRCAYRAAKHNNVNVNCIKLDPIIDVLVFESLNSIWRCFSKLPSSRSILSIQSSWRFLC